ncbi:hypothetical protein [Embleya sp. NPDC005575]|uniref:type II toxin-antitoxin system RelE family toxin n=1 Tax=Embleya sp. NPDC005575 TaxID=3156892 RepID=UPI0033B3B023
MSTYRVAYAPEAARELDKLPRPRRAAFDRAIDRVANDPYGSGAAIGGDKDRREATVTEVFIVYLVSASVLTVTVVRAVPEPR